MMNATDGVAMYNSSDAGGTLPSSMKFARMDYGTETILPTRLWLWKYVLRPRDRTTTDAEGQGTGYGDWDQVDARTAILQRRYDRTLPRSHVRDTRERGPLVLHAAMDRPSRAQRIPVRLSPPSLRKSN